MNILYGCVPVQFILLTKGKTSIVDERDYEWLSQVRWYFAETVHKGVGYAARIDLSTGKRVRKTIHREVFLKHSGMNREAIASFDIDHRNGDRLDNRFENLRLASRTQNSGNRTGSKNNTTGYKGVKADKNRQNVWIAQISDNGKRFCLGYFNSPEEAALAYNEAALRVFGEFAYLNEVQGVETFTKRVYKTSKEFKSKGVSFHKRSKKWQAYAKVNGKRKYLGYFPTEQEAVAAYERFIGVTSKANLAT